MTARTDIIRVMPTDHILSLLIAEREKLNAAISLLGGTPAKRRGRPPKSSMPNWVTGNGAAAPVQAAAPTKKKRNFSPAQREAARKRAKAMWAKRKKAAKKG